MLALEVHHAPLVITFSDPSVHSEVRSVGVPGHRQLKVPVCAVAASMGEARPPAGENGQGEVVELGQQLLQPFRAGLGDEKVRVTGAASSAPPLPWGPSPPEGKARDSVEVGMKGAVAAKVRVVGATWVQVPLTGGIEGRQARQPGHRRRQVDGHDLVGGHVGGAVGRGRGQDGKGRRRRRRRGGARPPAVAPRECLRPGTPGARL